MRAWRLPTPPIDEFEAPIPGAPISVTAVDAHRGRRLALSDVTFALPPGSVTAVVGPNGAGKSSLFGLISGRLQPSRGAVEVAGPVAEVLQMAQVDDELPLTVEDVVRIGRYPSTGLIRPMRREDRSAVRAALEAVDLFPLRRRPISQLSGGQRQRALVAQGLAQHAPILLLDEPTAGLDRQSRQLVLTLIRAEADRGTTVMFATHDLSEAALADNVIALACECVCCAPPVTALADPAVTALFGPVDDDEVELDLARSDEVDQPMASRASTSA